jgi:indole-3-glycerol phosphate synthase/phosphoribosylanthranilate isomerase
MGRFRDVLARPGLQAIAEIKRRSPSAGDLRPDADPRLLAPAFARAGAAAISVLVDDRFGGSIADLRAARAATEAPLVGKGFFSEEDQIRELAEAGADAFLLILRDLSDEQVTRLRTFGAGLGMDALVEAHDERELERAVRLGADPLGINCRDLSTLAIDRARQLELLATTPRDRVVVAESGIWSRAQGAAAELAGADAVLVGSALMRAPDPTEKLRELISRPLVKICGLTRQEDVTAVAEAGADMAGFILAAETPRRAPGILEVPETILSVAVFVGAPRETGADLVQLYELESGHRSRDAVLCRDSEPVATVLDLPWESGDPAHLDRAAAAAREGRLMLAGGLDPVNVSSAIERVRPWAVDASSALETAPGVKDHARVREFVQAVEQARSRRSSVQSGVRLKSDP